MLDLDQFRQDVHILSQAISMEAEDADTDRQVELAFFLWKMINEASKVLDTIKEAHLRPAALKQAKGSPGPQILTGSGYSECEVRIPEPTYRLKKGADLNTIRSVLGDRYIKFFQENLNVEPRREAGNLVAQLKDQKTRRLLLESMTEFEGTPRVSLRQVDPDKS